MTTELEHGWDVTPEEAIEIQERLRHKVIVEDDFGEIRYVAGVDIGFEAEGTVTRAAIAVLRLEDLSLQDYAIARLPTSFPYIPGFLSFREIPAARTALASLKQQPDILLCDGQGIAHPRRLGIASHLGLLTNMPAIGVAKTLLTGRHGPLADEKGAWEPLVNRNEVIGAVLRTRAGTKPLYISSGHRISLQSAIDLVMRCTTKYRLPETTRWAHRLASSSDSVATQLRADFDAAQGN